MVDQIFFNKDILYSISEFLDLTDIVKLMRTCKGLLNSLGKNNIWKKFNKIDEKVNVDYLIEKISENKIINIKLYKKEYYNKIYYLTVASFILFNDLNTNLYIFSDIENHHHLCKIYKSINIYYPREYIDLIDFIRNSNISISFLSGMEIKYRSSIKLIRIKIDEKIYNVSTRSTASWDKMMGVRTKRIIDIGDFQFVIHDLHTGNKYQTFDRDSEIEHIFEKTGNNFNDFTRIVKKIYIFEPVQF